MNKKILFITPMPSDNVKGGIASWTYLLIEHGLPDKFKFRIIDNSINGKRKLFEINKYSLFNEVIRNFKIIFNLIKELLFYRPSLIHLNCSLSKFGVIKDFILLIIAKFFLIPILVHYRGNLPQEWMDDNYLSFSSFCLNFLIKNSNMNLAMNYRSFLYLNKRSKKLKNKILGSFIEDSVFNYENKNLNYSHNLKIIYVGAFTKSKGAIEILELAKCLVNQQFIIIGKVSSDINSYISNLPKNICILGQMNRDKIIEYLQKSDVFLFPSHSEGFPNSVLEAMALGLPVVASDAGAISEMIEQDIGGYVVKIGEVDKMKEHLEHLSLSPELRKSMGLFNKKKSKDNYSYKIISKKLVDSYKFIIEN